MTQNNMNVQRIMGLSSEDGNLSQNTIRTSYTAEKRDKKKLCI